MMTANFLKWTNSANLIQATIEAHPGSGINEIGSQLHEAGSSFVRFSRQDRAVLDRGEAIYRGLCFACHGQDGQGAHVPGSAVGATIAPPFARNKLASEVCDSIVGAVLKGMKGPVMGKTYDALMVPMEGNDDAWVAAVTSYIRNSFGNSAPLVRPADVARVREAFKDRKEPWTEAELRAAVPQVLRNRGEWKATANYNSDKAPLALDGDIHTRYDTGVSQVPGMWFQIELPKPTYIAGLRLDAASSTEDYPRGYKVDLSNDGVTWKSAIADRPSPRPLTDIFFPPAEGKFIRVTQTGSVNGLYWSIHELNIYTPGVVAKTAPNATPEKSKYE
jgi:mono/diheme cytochrome c family protein